MAQDVLGNRQSSAVKVVASTLDDQTPPSFTLVRAVSVTDFSFVIEVKLDELGSFTYVVASTSAPPPNVTQVLAGTDGNNAAPIKAGSTSVVSISSSSTALVQAAGVQASTPYTVHVVASDDASPPNTQASVTSFPVTTLADATPPTWSTSQPSVADVTGDSFVVVGGLSEPGWFSYTVLAPGRSSPVVADVIAGTDGDGVAAAAAGRVEVPTAPSATFKTTVSGLAANTAYDVWFVAGDDEPTANVQATAAKVDVTTAADTTPPLFAPGFPVVDTVGDMEASLALEASEAATAFWMVTLPGVTTPSVANVQAGVDSSGGAAVASGTVTIPSSGVVVNAAVDSVLTPSTAYVAWVVLRDTALNMQAAVTSLNLTTTADATEPEWCDAYPRITSVSDQHFDLIACVSKGRFSVLSCRCQQL